MVERSYAELIKLKGFKDRLDYLILLDYEYNSPRRQSYHFFRSHTWRNLRAEIIRRDMAFDLGVLGVYIPSKLIVHHINPITVTDIERQTKWLLDPNYLITTSIDTHNIIHYGEPERSVERTPGDTILW
jgi:hypothetical protein